MAISNHGEDNLHEEPAHHEQMIAIVRASGNEQLPADQKEQLWQTIAADINRKPRVIRWQLLKAAAVILVLITAGVWSWQQLRSHKESAVVAFAAGQQSIAAGGASRVILGNNKQLVLKGSRTAITYGAGGNSLRVDSQTVQQAVAENSLTFNTLLVPYGNTAFLQLSDGSKVWLNAGSRLIYPIAFTEGKREVYLEGEAYFDIAADPAKPFSVYAADLKVAVLGTAFNVSAYKDDPFRQVVLASGAVQLKPFRGKDTNTDPVTLKPGNKAVYAENAGMAVVNVDISEYISWKEGIIVAAHMPLYEILKKLSRYYNQPIETDTKSGNETFSGKLDLQKSVDDVLNIIAATTSLNYQKQGKKIIFKTR
ncbi:MAG TPA: FecR domain-containing protein [Chitinophaga sp.]|uniref:FecR family protein n=1 Tax=Chitinophaga sp. TaxID=1869181 RepID=UPI002CD1AB9F|nr:FecR domain-containing protein [Chitinophaga sp.]HVI49216.1 FecR domain-containing protein [Chitinophaga sp.]